MFFELSITNTMDTCGAGGGDWARVFAGVLIHFTMPRKRTVPTTIRMALNRRLLVVDMFRPYSKSTPDTLTAMPPPRRVSWIQSGSFTWFCQEPAEMRSSSDGSVVT